MFEDILDEKSRLFVPYPLHHEINYFKDGEGMEYEVNITEQELVDSLPLFFHGKVDEEKCNLLIDKMSRVLVLDRCLHYEKNLI